MSGLLVAIVARDARLGEEAGSRAAIDRRLLISIVRALARALDSVGDCHGCIDNGHDEEREFLRNVQAALDSRESVR